ncbi:PH and SEC7 domain-containing protein isoform X3 [Rhagoletis pomonella]|uniref:PH and SEC7 domain-containing protein isoform X3 n=1 Tax=Rhagoletis pomonella TaxID=28610 RepID=UPI00177E6F2F|nr:PH and SEC7 domain-containing protein isoform X3 [Rhagoletis pomonella]
MDSGSWPGFDDEPPPEPRDGWLLVRVHVPELNVYKCLQFPSDRLVWDVKQQVLSSLPKELKESFNYGLFCPPSNGKAGKFLDEERRLGDYPFNGPVGYLELKYKRRVYKMLNLDERQLKALHTRANLRRFLECINAGHVEKIAKMCAKGLDPNFHCPESGETPLTVATGAKKPNKLLIALVNGGALLDYRTKDGTTALHRAVEKDSLEAVTTLLELGASPNYKDGRGITPLYVSIARKCDPKVTENLLHDHATLGIQDTQGWNEVHQACRHGLVQHLEHLLFYGADMDGRNASGNTPLHVCAVNNQEACAKMLLFRGAQRAALNYANQTPYQVAVIAGNMELAEIIQNYKPDDVVLFRGPPRYNPKRRSTVGWPSGSCAGSCAGSLMGTLSRNGTCGQHGPPSPCPSEHIPYSSASSSLSEGSSGHRSHEDDISIVTDKSLGDTSDIISDSSGVGTNSDSAACSIGHPSTTVVCMEPYPGNTTGHISLQPGDVIEVVGSTDCGLLEGYIRGSNQSGFFPADCVQEVNLRQKNITNVSLAAIPVISGSSNTSSQSPYSQHTSMDGSISGSANKQSSPQLSMPSVRMAAHTANSGGTLPRSSIPPTHVHHSPSVSLNSNGSGSAMNGGNADTESIKSIGMVMSKDIANGGSGAYNAPQLIGQYNSATAPRMKKSGFNDPRTVVLHRAKRGFGFILRGAKASSPLMQLKPTDRFPALQYLDDVDPGGVADMAGLRPGDFLLAIGGEDVRAASHEKVVEMIRSAGALVSMTVISPQFPNQMQASAQFLPSSHPLSSGPSTPQTSHRQCATLPRKMSMGPGSAATASIGTGSGRMPAPLPPRRDPKTTLSVGRARAKSMVAGLESGGEKDDDDLPHTKSSSVESIVTPTPTHPGTPVQLRTASIKARPTSSRITAAELEELFQRQQGEAIDGSNRYSTMMTTSRFQSGTDSGAATPPACTNSPMKAPLVYGSVAEMKRKTKTKNGTLRGKPCPIPIVGGTGARDLKRFHSTPDLNAHLNGSASSIWAAASKGHHSQDDVATLHASMQRLNMLPPPTHPPPPPPVGQVIKVETRSTSEYESTLSLQQKLKKRAESDVVTAAAIDGVQSSFNPSANAKIYASPQELRNVMAWKLRQAQESRQSQSSQPHQQQQQQQLQQPLNLNIPTTPITQSTINHPTKAQKQISSSQYAQPTISQVVQQQKQEQKKEQQPQQTLYDESQRNGNTEVSSSNNNNITTGSAPPIPEPDYSFSESDGEDENSILVARNTKLNEKIALIEVPETSGNSQASGSSSGSASISHSLSVDEIQRVRSNLKQSKSSPNGFLKNESGQRFESANTVQSKPTQSSAEDQKNNNKDSANQANEVNEEEGDKSSSSVSSDQEVAGGTSKRDTPKSTDTIKKKPSVTIDDEPKTTPNPAKEPQNTTTQSNVVEESVVDSADSPASFSRTITNATAEDSKPVTASTSTTPSGTLQDTSAVVISDTEKIPTSTVASTAAAFEAKATATTVTVKQMVQQQHAPVIQQQQQQMSATKVKSLVIQSQQISSSKVHANASGRLSQPHSNHTKQQQTAKILPVNIPQQHLHPNQKLLATQQHIFLQQQQQQHHQQQQQQQQLHQQQLAHQQHLQQILKAKAAAAGVAGANTAAIVTKQQQQLHKKSQHEMTSAVFESEHEQRSEDEGDLSPSPPAKAFQRHNSLTRKQAAAIAMQRATRSAAVSLMQLPPPIEADSDNEPCVTAGSGGGNNAVLSAAVQGSGGHAGGVVPIGAENIVLAPPPQFCDCNDIKHAPQQQLHHMPPAQQHLQQQQPQQHMHLQQQQQYQLQVRAHMQMHGSGGGGGGGGGGTAAMNVVPGNVGTLGRVRLVGTAPKTTHHRFH